MTGSFFLDWAIMAVSLFNTILLLWLGLTVLLNAERRTWGVWLAGGGLLPPIRLSGRDEPAAEPPPTLGQHSGVLLAELGDDAAESGALREAGVVSQPAGRVPRKE